MSTTLESDFCVEALLQEVLSRFGQPQIFNTDQGSQFTNDVLTDVLRDRKIKISMDGKKRYLDNIFVERLWRSIQYEEVYRYAYDKVPEARTTIGHSMRFYNEERFHEALGYQTPAACYDGLAARAA